MLGFGEKWKKLRYGRRKFLRENKRAFREMSDKILDRVASEMVRSHEKMMPIPSYTIWQQVRDVFREKINELYAYPSLPDLEFEEASAKMKGRILDLNITVKNEGLANSGDFEIVVYGDGKEIKRIESDGMQIGYSQKITLTNNLITQLKVNSMEFSIEADFEEINKDNNKIVLDNIN